jgi:hypothetical protein
MRPQNADSGRNAAFVQESRLLRVSPWRPYWVHPSPMSMPLKRLIDNVIAVLVRPGYRSTGLMEAVLPAVASG